MHGSRWYGRGEEDIYTGYQHGQLSVIMLHDLCVTVCWMVVLRLNIPVNNFSVMSGRSHRFLGN